MKLQPVSRREFIRTSVALAGAATLSPWSALESRAEAVKRTATDQVTLGKSGVKLSRLGVGTGINNGEDQVILGKEEWIKLIHYAYDHGITYFDCAERYKTFGWMGDAIKDLPREKLYIQSKVWGQPEDVLGTIDRHRKTFNTDYVDSLLIHCMTDGAWVDKWKRIRDGFDEAKEKKWIRIRGVSCHSLPALTAAAGSDWPEVHLVRVNPEGNHMDAAAQVVWSNGNVDVSPVLREIKTMKEKGHGVIGMKICGNGDFRQPEQREKSIRFAMANKDIDAIVIGFTQPKEIDEAIERMNRALAEG